ncbi:transporter substrate-binding domain-containing protein [Breoghania sp.]|uniref:transporter substrate-binding domain-containing protein n=1 Tax=Breoghania sp. TaxID=2065378 RepID=UPI002AA758DF|nr:transporter substrate-binding domain-containing protein [Breoghania sp.]
MKRVLISAAVVALFGLTPALAQDALERAKSAGVLQVATEEQFPPYDFIEDGTHVGINVDIFAELGKELGLKIEYTDLPWSSVLPGLSAKKYDVVAGPAAITAERMQRFRFLIPIDSNSAMVMKRKGDTQIMKSEDIAGKTVGAQRASTPLSKLKTYVETLSPAPKIVEYVDNSQAYADLAAGRLDAVANASTNTLYSSVKRADVFEAVTPGFGAVTYTSFLGRKDDDSKSLLDALDAAMLKLRKDGRMAAIQQKWYGHSYDLPDTVPTPAK